MRNRLVIVAVLLTLTQVFLPIFGQTADSVAPNGQKQGDSRNQNKKPSAAVSAVLGQNNSTRIQKPEERPANNEQSTINIINPAPVLESWSWHDKVAWGASLLLLLVAAVTLWWFIIQTIATKKAAEASLAQTNHIITSERAWMIAAPEDAVIPPEVQGATGVRWTEFSVRFVNKGKTPAFLREIGYRGIVLPHGETLPINQPPYEEKEISKWDGNGLPLLPEADVRKNHVGTWANDPVRISRGFDVLWVCGYIKYDDAFTIARETWYCYRWAPEIKGHQVSGFFADGPESYNRAT
jgi:hypothetical protein